MASSKPWAQGCEKSIDGNTKHSLRSWRTEKALYSEGRSNSEETSRWQEGVARNSLS